MSTGYTAYAVVMSFDLLPHRVGDFGRIIVNYTVVILVIWSLLVVELLLSDTSESN